jgi:hypothetical protein
MLFQGKYKAKYSVPQDITEKKPVQAPVVAKPKTPQPKNQQSDSSEDEDDIFDQIDISEIERGFFI